MTDNIESVQILNTAIIRSKEKKIDTTYEKRLREICKSPTLKAISKSIYHLSEIEKISHDQAALQIIETVRELDSIWSDYVMMEGIDQLKSLLKNSSDS